MSEADGTVPATGKLGERAEAFVRLLRGALTSRAEGSSPRSRLAHLLDRAEATPARRDEVLGGLSALLAAGDGTSLFGEAGVPSDRGFLAELGNRVSSLLIPSPRDAHDLEEVVSRLFRSSADVEALRDLPLSDVHRLVRFVEGGLTAEAKASAARGFADGFRLLLVRLQAQGLARELRSRASPGSLGASPFSRVHRSGDALLETWLSGRDLAPALQAFRKDSGDCRKEARVIQRHLEEAGVSVDVVFGLEVIDRCLTRTALMADVMEAAEDGPDRSRAIHRLLARLVRLAHEDRSVRHLVGWNLHLLTRRIVDRSGKTGEHYVASTPSEYRHVWVAAAGGGAITVLTAAFKMLVHDWHLAPFPESFLFGLNYAVSFLLMQAFGFVLATKQPAMTAATLAKIMREARGGDRDERIASFFARLVSSQLAAAVSNVATVSAGAAAFVAGWLLLAGKPWVDAETARDTFLVLSPLDSGTLFFAALTGVLLWMGSLAGGWFENWSTYHRLPEGVARHPLGRTFGPDRMTRAAESLSRNASGWATNVALGFLLGFAPAVGRFFGVPFDVRHVTLSTGQLALAASSLGEGWFAGGTFLRGVAGIAVMFVLNLSVAFSLSLLNAARAYEMPPGELAGVLRHVLRHALRRPLDFVKPPRPGSSSPSEEPGQAPDDNV